MARTVDGKKSVSGWLYDTLAALQRGDHEMGEAQLSDLMGDMRRLLRPTPKSLKKGSVRPAGFAGDEFGLDRAALKQLETSVMRAQSFTRARDLKSAAASIRQASDEWTRTTDRDLPTILK